ncbi:hypothetical protein WA158_003427 [Blastocystis sp. Blastoise]
MLSRVSISTIKNIQRSFACCPKDKTLFETILERQSVRKYKPESIPQGVLEECIGATLTAPTAKNWQPYKIVVLRDKQDLARLSSTMITKNAHVINQVPSAVIFLSDQKPGLLDHEYLECSKRMGKKETATQAVINATKASLPENEYEYKNQLKQALEASKTTLAMLPYTAREWSIKNTIFAVQTFVLAAQAKGLGTIIMEGYDGKKIQDIIGCGDRYIVTDVVACGVPDVETNKPTLRYPIERMVYEGKFGNVMKNIPNYRE